MKPTTELQPLTEALLTRFRDSDTGLTAIVDLAVLVAMADGRIDEAEMAALASTLHAIMGARLAAAVAKHLVTESRAKIRVVGAEARARDIGATLRVYGSGEDALRLAFAVAWTSEGISSEERAIIDVVAEAAGVPLDRVNALAIECAPAGAA